MTLSAGRLSWIRSARNTRIEDGDGKDYSAEPRKWMEEETLNSQTAVDPKQDEISDEEYNEFYQKISRDWTSHGIGFTCASKE